MNGRLNHFLGKLLVYSILAGWSFICLFPIYWTFTTSFKKNKDIVQGHLIPWLDFTPDWIGWRSIGLSPDRIGVVSTVRDEFLLRFENSVIVSTGSAGLALVLGTLAAYGLVRFQYRFLFYRNDEISFFFLSQLILPPVALALPILAFYNGLALLDTKAGLIIIYALSVLPIVLWVMRDQFASIPIELEHAAMVDGCSIWGVFVRIVLPLAGPGMVAAFILALILCWNEYFIAALLTSTNAKTLPVMVASQVSTSGIGWWTMAALSFASILPLVLVGLLLERFIVKGLTAGAGK